MSASSLAALPDGVEHPHAHVPSSLDRINAKTVQGVLQVGTADPAFSCAARCEGGATGRPVANSLAAVSGSVASLIGPWFLPSTDGHDQFGPALPVPRAPRSSVRAGQAAAAGSSGEH